MRALFLGSAITIVSASFALAADLGQYRPGNPYQSVIAPGADVCESHCSGDAQCRSWNYIKANPQAAGVCEFNSNDAAPVASAISISGTNMSSPYRSGVVAGRTNTVRVGTQSVTRPAATTQRTQSNRRIVREAVPQQKQVQRASMRPVTRPSQPSSLTAQKNQYRQRMVQPQPMSQPQQRPRQAPVPVPQTASRSAVPQQFKYDLGGQGAVRPQQNRHQAPAQRPVAPQASQYPTQSYAPQPPQAQRGAVSVRDRRRQQGPSVQRFQVKRPQAQEPVQSQGQAFPPQMAPQVNPMQQAYAPQQPMVRRSANQPVTARQSPQALARGLTAEQVQQSLFGKLNDDVIVPNTSAVVPKDPNAPIPTSASRPVIPVQQSSLEGLAGAPQN